jgi:hypothetical protein
MSTFQYSPATELVRRNFRGSRRSGVIYFALDPTGREVKIGFTGAERVAARIEAIERRLRKPLGLLGAIGATMFDERELHHEFAAYRVRGEWFNFSGECRAAVEHLLATRGGN